MLPACVNGFRKEAFTKEKNMSFHVAHLVVLLPAVLASIVGFFALVAPWFKSRMESKEFVEVLRDTIHSIGFIGPAAGVIIGVGSESAVAYAFAGALFLVAMVFVNALTRNLESLNERQSIEDQRKLVTAVIDEIAKVEEARLSSQRETWRD